MTDKKEQPNVVKTKSGLEIKIQKVNLDERCEINDKLAGMQEGKPYFSLWIWLLRKVTKLSDNEINELSMDEITEISIAIFESLNKKKITK